MAPSTTPRLALTLCLLAALGSAQATQDDGVKVDIREAASTIDRLVQCGLAKAQQAPNPLLDDATFLRRAYLAIVGRIPTLAEAQAFGREGGSGRREALVDRLLDAPGHVSHEVNWWADLLRARSRLMRQVSGEPFLDWIGHQVAANTPYDAMVRAMLTASGPAHARGNGATGYLLRDLEMPLDSMANSVRVFLGTRLECAQCHNHPFDKWTQLQFYQMAAFTGGLRYRTDFERSEAGQRLAEAGRQAMQEHGQQARQAMRRILLPLGAGLSGSGTGLLRLPDKYVYDDARPSQIVAAATIFGEGAALDVTIPKDSRRAARAPRGPRGQAPPVGKEVDSRVAFADWLASAENPRFALVLANRLWKRYFGRGLIEPVDDLKDDTEAVNPELLGYLEQLAIDLRFDVKELQRVLLRTQLFQRAAETREVASEEAYLFPGPLLTRMSAEQLWDSLVTLAVPDPDAGVAGVKPRAEETYRRYEELASASPEELAREIDRAVLRATDPEQFRALERERRAGMLRERLAEQSKKQQEARPQLRALAAAKRQGDDAKVRELEARLRELGVPLPGERGRRPDLVRASELPQPAPASHPLRELGQSDRETIDASHREANVPQALTLINGFVEDRLLSNRSSALRLAIDAAKTTGEKVKTAFRAVLARAPEPGELADWTRACGGDAEAGLRDLVWVLVNSHEFRFVR